MKKNDQPCLQTQTLIHQQQLQTFAAKIFSSRFQDFLFYSFLVGIGFGFGVLLSFHNKVISMNSQISRLTYHYVSLPPLPHSPLSPPPQTQTQTQPQPQTRPQKQMQAQPLKCTFPGAPKKEEKPRGRVGLRDFLEGPEDVTHDMTDEELMWLASMAPKMKKTPFSQTQKVAFMFLTRGRLPLAPLWEKFFKGHEGFYSLYVHTSNPNYVDLTPETSPFYGRRIPSKKVEWGKVSMVEAERRLLANALLDFSNRRFVLLSESDIPLFNFTTIYTYLTKSHRSFVNLMDDPGPTGRGRYSHRMSPLITLDVWRKGSQWFELDRELALEVVSDTTYFPLFKKHCHGGCYADEHYLPTLVQIKYPDKTSDRTLMWADWSRGGPHPLKYMRKMVTRALLRRLRRSKAKCEYNGGKTHICHLFARKFDEKSLNRLLLFAPKIMGF